jgi:hypothetical protein
MIDFWIPIGGAYSHLSVMRLRAVENESGVSLAAVLGSRDHDRTENIPFVGKPVKLAYMWRDIERRARTRPRAVTARAVSARGI